MTRRDATRCRLHLEPLEDRSLPTTAILSAGILTVTGTAGPDTIVVRRLNNLIAVDGTPAEVPAAQVTQFIINAGAGNDTVRLNSQDTPGQQLLGVPVIVNAGDGDDTVIGTTGADYLFGQNGNDVLMGGAGGDFLFGSNGQDRLDGGDGDDYLYGDYGNDVLLGGNGNDVDYGGADNDYIDGGLGDDLLVGGTGRDALNGGDGIDRFQDDYARPGAAGVVAAIATRQTGDATWAAAGDVRQQLANTCSLLSSLAAFARTSPADLASRINYDATSDKYLVPLFVNNSWQKVAVSFNGTWTDNDPYPGEAAADGSRDYWVVLYQRAYLQALNVNTNNADASQWSVRGTRADELTKQNWRYPDVALQAVTGSPASAWSVGGDSGVQAIAAAVRGGHDVVANTQTMAEKSSFVNGTGLIFSHTYAVLDADAQSRTVTLRNPWDIDGQSSTLAALPVDARNAFTLGNDGDGVVRVSWSVFERAFATYVVA